MFFVFDFKNPIVLIYYIFVILMGLFLDSLGIFSVEKTVGLGILGALIFYVVKTLLGCNCQNREK
jgi:hypothetical protein